VELFFIRGETRGYVIVDTGRFGLVALIPMGMAQVSSVKFEDSVKPGSQHNKGEMLGNFLFGGSDFVMLFQKRAGFVITAPRTGKEFKHLLMGEAYGIMMGAASNIGSSLVYWATFAS
jgi:phosphatidylserine decarboxylase